MEKIIIAGVDYSMSCPALCMYNGSVENFNFEDCTFSYITNHNVWSKSNLLDGKIVGYGSMSTDCFDIDRMSHLSDTFLDCIDDINVNDSRVHVGLEDYAFQGKGKITLLAENMGILKYKLRENHHIAKSYTPLTIKKYARNFLPIEAQKNDKGKPVNMGKEEMHNAFREITGVDLLKVFGLEKLLTLKKAPTRSNPITDIVDAYFIARYHKEQVLKK